jgi:hypothetical protein
MVPVRSNPRNQGSGQWFIPAKYPDGVVICPLCRLPETTGEYRRECKCWPETPKEST